MERYVQLAKELTMADAVLTSPDQIFFDIRAILKCRWGCEDFFRESVKCGVRNTTFQERVEMVRNYSHILVVHSHDSHQLSKALLQLEKAAFLDGHYFAFVIRYCNACGTCSVNEGKPCLFPEKVRPCDQAFGIDVYKTVRGLGLPCEVLQDKTSQQNRYGFLLID